MAEKKTHKLVAASENGAAKPQPKPAPEVGNATGLRIGAVVLWAAAIIFEVLAVLIVFGKINMTFLPVMWQLIIMIVLDLACVIIGAQLWKKANRIKPASERNKLKFWLWNNMGVIACIIAFVPIIILMLTNKELDKKTKAIAVAVAAVALIIGGLASYDFEPISQEQQQTAMAAIDGQVYWTPYGHVYHTHEDCSHLNQTDTLTVGSVEQAIAAGRERLCMTCARRDSIDVSGIKTDET